MDIGRDGVMTPRVSLSAWEHGRGDATPTEAAIVAAGRLEAPSLQLEVVGGRGEYLTVLILSGTLSDPAALLYVENHGAYEVVSVEPWPETGRFLVLRPWSRTR
jgi:hypothetical protein